MIIDNRPTNGAIIKVWCGTKRPFYTQFNEKEKAFGHKVCDGMIWVKEIYPDAMNPLLRWRYIRRNEGYGNYFKVDLNKQVFSTNTFKNTPLFDDLFGLWKWREHRMGRVSAACGTTPSRKRWDRRVALQKKVEIRYHIKEAELRLKYFNEIYKMQDDI